MPALVPLAPFRNSPLNPPIATRKQLARMLSFVASSSTYTLATVLSAAVGFALIPLLTRYLTPEDFGIYGLLFGLETLLAPLLVLNAHIMIQRRHNVLGEVGLGALIRTVNRIRIRLLAVALVLAVSIALVMGPGSLPLWAIAATVVIAAMDGATSMTVAVFIMRRRPGLYLALRMTFLTASTLAVLVTVVGFGFDWQGRFIGLALGVAAANVPSIILLRRSMARTPNRLPPREIVRFGGPLLPHTAGIWANNFLDRFIVAGMLGIGPAGVYVAAYSISLAFDAVHSGVSMALLPSSYPRLDSGKESDRRWLARVYYVYCAITAVLFAIVAPIAAIGVGPLLGGEFARAAELMPWLLLGHSFMGIARVGSTYLYAAERTGQRAALTAATVVLGAGYSVVGIMAGGLIGAAIAMAATFATNALLTTVAAWRTGLLPGIRRAFSACNDGSASDAYPPADAKGASTQRSPGFAAQISQGDVAEEPQTTTTELG